MAIWERMMAAIDAFKNFNVAEPQIYGEGRYDTRWGLYDGSMFDRAWRRRPPRDRDPRLYVNTRLLWKHVESTVDFYATTVYQGSLSTDGQPLSGGQAEAIPIDAQVSQALGLDPDLDLEAGKDPNDQLRLGLAELWNATNWRQQMMLRPMYGACLGDCLTEIVDDVESKKVVPVTVWPGYVADLELDSVGNVKWLAIEYDVHIKPRSLSDTTTREEQYRYRKELSGEDFRYYKDGKLFDYDGPNSSIIPNPYRLPSEKRGFVPAVWDRHKQVPGDHGHCAFEGTLQALLEVNSFLSHGFDYQRKHFASPVLIQGQISTPSSGLRFGPVFVSTEPDEVEAAAEYVAENTDVLFATGDVGIHTVPTDLGQAMTVLDWLKAGIERENPEGTFYEKLGNMTQSTGPAMERALGNAVSRVRWARAGYDVQTVKQHQMQLAISGFRINHGDWGPVSQLSSRQRSWTPFGLDSYRRGYLDFSILDRGVVMQTPEETVKLVILKEQVVTPWGMRAIGIDDETIAEISQEREDQDLAFARSQEEDVVG